MKFYGEKLGLELGMLEETRRIAFYFIGGWNKTMLGLWEKPGEEIHSQHLAFEVPLNEFDVEAEKLRSNGITTKNFFNEDSHMPQVFGWMPAVSTYFNDPDGHLLEIIARLPGDPEPDKQLIPWDEWKLSHNL
jgi:catechol 2,3-dioxygenase-like lactoylglutathione lyase family enzyme